MNVLAIAKVVKKEIVQIVHVKAVVVTTVIVN